MKRWAALVVLLYVASLGALAVPLLLLCFGDWRLPKDSPLTLSEALQVYKGLGFWIWLVVLGAGEALLLLLPIRNLQSETGTPGARRPLRTAIVTSSFFFANLCLGSLLSVWCAIQHDQAFEVFAYAGGIFQKPDQAGSAAYVTGMIVVQWILWMIWGFIFYRFSKNDSPEGLIARAVKWLLRGSILELLIAVPSHIIVRRRQDCCAPAGTFWGIATGISIMLLAFGPGIFFLFVERFERLKPKSKQIGKTSPTARTDR